MYCRGNPLKYSDPSGYDVVIHVDEKMDKNFQKRINWDKVTELMTQLSGEKTTIQSGLSNSVRRRDGVFSINLRFATIEKGGGGGVPGSGMAFLRRDQILSDFYNVAIPKYGAKREDESKYITNILLHELGAAIGLGHSDDRRNIMYKDSNEESLWYIKYFDLEQMRYIRRTSK